VVVGAAVDAGTVLAAVLSAVSSEPDDPQATSATNDSDANARDPLDDTSDPLRIGEV